MKVPVIKFENINLFYQNIFRNIDLKSNQVVKLANNLINCEQCYYWLNYVDSSYQKENIILQYNQLENDITTHFKKIPDLLNDMILFVKIRLSMINMYYELKQNHCKEKFDSCAILSVLNACKDSLKGFNEQSSFLQSKLIIEYEIIVLINLINSHECLKFFDHTSTIIYLIKAHEYFMNLIKCFSSIEIKQSSKLFNILSSKMTRLLWKNSQPPLFEWMHKLYYSLLSKYSFYFTSQISKFNIHNDIRMSDKLFNNYTGKIQQFVQRTNCKYFIVTLDSEYHPKISDGSGFKQNQPIILTNKYEQTSLKCCFNDPILKTGVQKNPVIGCFSCEYKLSKVHSDYYKIKVFSVAGSMNSLEFDVVSSDMLGISHEPPKHLLPSVVSLIELFKNKYEITSVSSQNKDDLDLKTNLYESLYLYDEKLALSFYIYPLSKILYALLIFEDKNNDTTLYTRFIDDLRLDLDSIPIYGK